MGHCFWGLSPRLRGNRTCPPRRELGVRSIPAPAGEPCCCSTGPGAAWVYPRACGEPNRKTRPMAKATVYPRACGGTSIRHIQSLVASGLSPRLRGTFSYTDDDDGRQGLSRACGEPNGDAGSSPLKRVYPRACGGTLLLLDRTRSRVGLSPRLRGNRTGRPDPWPRRRSIPAPAGEPPSGISNLLWRRVYPRACGEPSPTLTTMTAGRVYPRACGGT